MPELPEVETIACDLRARGLEGATIEAVRVSQPQVIRGQATRLRRGLKGRRIESVGRHGKLLLLGLSGGLTLSVHLKMTGQVYLIPAGEPLLKHTHVVLSLDGSRELRYRDVRRFGRLALLDAEGLRAVLAELGPDALGVSEAEFRRRLTSRRGRLKPVLLDQGLLAGLGNIYANEMLFAAGLNPWRSADSLSRTEVKSLYGAMRRVLREAIQCRGSSTSDFVDAAGRSGRYQDRHLVYRKESCPRCKAKLVRDVKGGRSTFWCPACQPAT